MQTDRVVSAAEISGSGLEFVVVMDFVLRNVS
jgi:hypothetical protein